MLTTIHLLVGANIGKYKKGIFLIIILAILSHYVLDFIPHYSPTEVEGYLDDGLNRDSTKDLIKKSIEPILGLALVIYLIYLNKENKIPIIIGAFFAWFPDLIEFIGWQFQINSILAIVPTPGSILYNSAPVFTGILIQVIIGIPLILALFFDLKKIKKSKT